MKTAIYMRVSTNGQTHDPQRQELVDFCAKRGWGDVDEYADVMSGAKFSREGLDRLMADVRRGRLARVVVVKLDRIGRSLPHLALIINEFDRHEVAIVCTSQGIDTSRDNPAGRLQMHVLMAVAEFERELISERTRAGLVAAKARGSVLGRRRWVPTAAQVQIIAEYRESRDAAKSLGERPAPIRELARRLGISVGAAHAVLHAEEK